MHVVRQENVSEHIGFSAMYAYVMAEDLSRLGHQIDFRSLMGKVVLHDVDESMSGDIMRGFKYSTDEVLDAITNASLINLVAYVSREVDGGEMGNRLVETWREAKDDSIEGRIVQFVDLLCVVAYCVEEVALGNVFLETIEQGARYMLNEMFSEDEIFATYIKDLSEAGLPDSWNHIHSIR